VVLLRKVELRFIIHSGATKGEANGQLPISFGDFPIEVLLFQNCLFNLKLDSNCTFFSSVWITYAFFACFFSVELRKEEQKNYFLYFNCKFGWTGRDSVLHPNVRYLLILLTRLPVPPNLRNTDYTNANRKSCNLTMERSYLSSY
jgi:hypothetical protein